MACRWVHLVAAFAAALSGFLAAGSASAQGITTDGTLGAKVTLAGPNYPITANLGTQIGGNLFHSFGKFGLVNGEIATFSGPATVSNVIGRVTGGSLSSVDGKIDASSIAGANLYLVNPSGVVFGPNATVNVAGSFHVSTADYLKLADGAKFQATNPSGSTLTAAAPAAFGFLTASSPALTINGSQLAVPAGRTLAAVGGPVTMTGGGLTAPAGTIHLTSAAGTGEVPVDPANRAGLTMQTFGTVNLSGGAKLDVSDPVGLGSGSVFVRAGTLTIDAGTINADNFGSGPGGTLSLIADNQISLTGASNIQGLAQAGGTGAAIALTTAAAGTVTVDNSTVKAGSAGSGAGGPITITGGQLSLHNSAGILATSTSSGASGNVRATIGGSVTVDSGGSLGTTASAIGDAGRVDVGAGGMLKIDMTTGAATSLLLGIGSRTTGAGRAGDVTLDAASLTISNYGLATSRTAGTGAGGKITVTVTGDLTLTGPGITAQQDTGLLAKAEIGSGGNAGDISVTAGSLTASRSGGIGDPTYGSGNGGNITVDVHRALTLDGTQSNPGFPTAIVTGTTEQSTGNAGSLAITADSLSITNGANIGGISATPGRGGNVSVTTTGAVTIDGTSGPPILTGILVGSFGSGDAGSVTLKAGSLNVTNGGTIFSGVLGPGRGGDITLIVAGPLSLAGASPIPVIPTGAVSGSLGGAPGSAGRITVNAGSLSVTDRAQIFSGTSGSGNAGSISVTVPGDISIDATAPHGIATGIVAGTFGGGGNGGDITVNGGSLTIRNGGSIGAGTFGSGNGGNISVDIAGAAAIAGTDNALSFVPSTGQAFTGISTDAVAINLALPPIGGILTTAFPGATGNAGNINLTAGSLNISRNGVIFSPTFGPGRGGDVAVNVTGALTISGTSQTGLVVETAGLPGPTGNAGNVTVSAGSISITDNGAISGHALLANGGNIDITAGDLLYLRNGTITTQVDASTGNGGNITITAPRAVLDHSQIDAAALGSGANGNITVNAGSFIQSADSAVTATGLITFTNPPTSLSSALVVLPSELRGAETVLRNSCAAKSALPRSSLTESGRGGLPLGAEAAIPALYLAGRDAEPGPNLATPAASFRLARGGLRVAASCAD